MRFIRPWYYDGEDEACFSEAIHPGSLVEESIEMCCALHRVVQASSHPHLFFIFKDWTLHFLLFRRNPFQSYEKSLTQIIPSEFPLSSNYFWDIRRDLHCVCLSVSLLLLHSQYQPARFKKKLFKSFTLLCLGRDRSLFFLFVIK